MALRFLLFFAIVLGVLAVGYGYVAWRLGEPLDDRGRRRVRWICAAVAVVVMGAFFGRVSGIEGPIGDVLWWLGFAALGASSLVFTFFVARDVVWLAARAVTRIGRRDAAAPSPERRRFLVSTMNAGKLGGSGVLFGLGFAQARDVPAVREVEVPIADLPEALAGFRIVQLTDLHVGPTIKRDYVEAVVARVNELAPDMVAITGDIVDGSVAYLQDDVAPLADLRARHGVFACTGNHEYYAGVEEWTAELERLGVRVLLNEHQVVEHQGAALVVAGVTDYLAGNVVAEHATDPERALAGAPAGLTRILLAHQPRSIFAASKLGVDLQLSGHTHGGQFFPWTFFAGLAQPYVSGLHRHDASWIYTSRGTGYWGPPLRLGAPSEITLLRLVRL
jgi:predicted MPP superfamily phosphohydrolase